MSRPDFLLLKGARWSSGKAIIVISQAMFSTKRFAIWTLFLVYSINASLQNTQGTVTSQPGRISNINNQNIHISVSMSLANCVRQCVDFTVNHWEYPMDDCFAYNYDMAKYTCELIHSSAPLDYTISSKSYWMAGFKYQS